MLFVNHFPESPGAHGTDSAVLHKQDGIRAVDNGVEVMGNHQDSTLVGSDGVFQGNLGKGIQMAGRLIQQQEVCVAGCQLGQLQQILFTAGEVTDLAAKAVGVKTVFLQVCFRLFLGIETHVGEFLINGILLLQNFRVELGEEGGRSIRVELNGRILVLPDFPEHRGFSGTIGTHKRHLFAGVNRKGDGFQQGFLKGQGVLIQSKQFHRLLRDFHLGQRNFGLTDFHKGCFDLTGQQTVQVADLTLQGTAVLGFRNFGCQFPQVIHQFGNPLNLCFIGQGCHLQIDFFLQTGVAVLRKAAFKFLEIAVFQMPDPVKAMGQQIAAVGDHQQRSLISVDQIPQAVEVFKVQEYIRFVHNQQAGTAQHLTNDLHQL